MRRTTRQALRPAAFLLLLAAAACGDGVIKMNAFDPESPPKSNPNSTDNNAANSGQNNGGPGQTSGGNNGGPGTNGPGTNGPGTNGPGTSGPGTNGPNGPDNNNTPPPCAPNEERCDGTCVDVMSNTERCGSCDNMCDVGGTCEQGVCEPPPLTCPAGEMVCDMMCVNTDSDAAHCGSCDNPCGGGMLCVDGSCEQPSEIVGVWTFTNDARATGADCGSQGNFGPTNPLALDPELNVAAQAHADDMAANNFFSHTGSDGSSFSQRIFRTNFVGSPVGENIAAGYGSPQEAVNGWLTSDGHCRNMLNPQATKLGVGYALGGPYGTLWVQVFGR